MRGSRPAHDIQSKVDPRTTDPSFEEHPSNKREWGGAEEGGKKVSQMRADKKTRIKGKRNVHESE